jgi:hypothetical protein
MLTKRDTREGIFFIPTLRNRYTERERERERERHYMQIKESRRPRKTYADKRDFSHLFPLRFFFNQILIRIFFFFFLSAAFSTDETHSSTDTG